MYDETSVKHACFWRLHPRKPKPTARPLILARLCGFEKELRTENVCHLSSLHRKETAEASMPVNAAVARRALAANDEMVSRGTAVSTVNSCDVCSAKPAGKRRVDQIRRCCKRITPGRVPPAQPNIWLKRREVFKRFQTAFQCRVGQRVEILKSTEWEPPD